MSDRIDEVAVATGKYVRAHGVSPKGAGRWNFHTTGGGETFSHEGDYDEAKRRAQAWASQRGHAMVHLREGKDLNPDAVEHQGLRGGGTVTTLRRGHSFGIVLHPEHKEAINKLADGESTKFRDETGARWHATKRGDSVHFRHATQGYEHSTHVSNLKENAEVQIDEVTQSSLKAGDKLRHGYRSHSWNAEFQGYTHHTDPFSEKPTYHDIKAVHSAYGTKTSKDLESHPEGRHVTALWKDTDNGDQYHAYLHKGKWSLGSSADPQKLMKESADDAGATLDDLVVCVVDRRPGEFGEVFSELMRERLADVFEVARPVVAATLFGGTPVEEDVEQVDETKKPNVYDAVGADSANKNKEGNHVFRREFFYSHGGSSEKWANEVSRRLTDAGIKHTVVKHQEIWKPFRGGASTAKSSHWAAHVKIHEDVEQVDEISKKTLGSYVNKAAVSLGNAAHAMGQKRSESDEIDRFTNRLGGLGSGVRDLLKKRGESDYDAIKKHEGEFYKRLRGIKKAADRLTKEDVEQVDEISRKTASEYIAKATRDRTLGRGSLRRQTNRATGVERASERLKRDD